MLKKINLKKLRYFQKKAIKHNPNSEIIYYVYGFVLNKLQRFDEAITCYKKAIEIKANYTAAHNNLGWSFKELGRVDESIICFKKAIELTPNYEIAHNNLANALHSLGRFDEAIISHEKAIALKPDFHEAYKDLGLLLYELNKVEKAAKYFELSDFRNSKQLLLKCLLELDQQSKFNKLIDSLIEQGKIDAVVGSVISIAEIKYGINKLNPFCNKPLNHVLKTDLTKQYDFKNTFVKTVNDVLSDNKVQKRFQGLLTNGVQTSGNIFKQRGTVTNKIEKIIYSEIEKYRIHFKDSNEGFLKNWPKDYYINGWLISMKSGGSLSPHMHELGWVSGSIYINIPAKSKPDSGNLVVSVGDRESATTSEKKIIDVVTGSLCLFPSSLYHYTIPFNADEERIVLAFDIMQK